jgi:nicotinamide riboside kinase
MPDRQIKVAITGAESTGKSTLSEALAIHYRSISIPEFSRSYIENLEHSYTYEDVEFIAQKQIEIEQNILPDKSPVFFDTWLIITKVWFDFVYGKRPLWLDSYIENSNIDLFLVCDIDLPWVYDPVRENGGENRKILHDIYIDHLKNFGFNYRIVSGEGEERIKNAIRFVDQLTNQK